MANTLYNNIVLENKVKGFLDTELDMSTLYTHDNSLVENAGLKKVINVYNATGNVEDLAQGEGNTAEVSISFTPQEYTVTTVQGKLPLFDEEILKDPMSLDTGLAKLSAQMVNNINSKFVAELGKATLIQEYPSGGIDFNSIVDATAKFGENETGLYMLINPAQRASLRKNLKDTLQYSEGFARTGYIGSINGIPVLVSASVPDDTAFIATADAVTVFTKKQVEVEVERNANIRQNIYYTRMINVVALTDANKVVKLTKAI